MDRLNQLPFEIRRSILELLVGDSTVTLSVVADGRLRLTHEILGVMHVCHQLREEALTCLRETGTTDVASPELLRSLAGFTPGSVFLAPSQHDMQIEKLSSNLRIRALAPLELAIMPLNDQYHDEVHHASAKLATAWDDAIRTLKPKRGRT